MFWGFHGPGSFYIFSSILGNLLWFLLLILLVASLLRLVLGRRRRWGPPFPPGADFREAPPFGPRHHQPPLSGLQILQQRYARGEIDATTFEQMRERLAASDRPSPADGPQ